MVSDHDDTKRVASYETRGVAVFKSGGRVAGPGSVRGRRTSPRDRCHHRRDGRRGRRPADPRPRRGRLLDEPRGDRPDRDPGERRLHRRRRRGASSCRSSSRASAARSRSCREPSVSPTARSPQIGDLLAEILEEDGIELRLGVHAEAVRVEGDERVVELDDGIGGARRGARRRDRPPTAHAGDRTGDRGHRADAPRHDRGRALPGRDRRLGDRRRDRDRRIHARRQVPGTHRRDGHHGAAGEARTTGRFRACTSPIPRSRLSA